jgi:hypothetical protein
MTNNLRIKQMINQNLSGSQISSETETLCRLYQPKYEDLCKRDANNQFANYDYIKNENLNEEEICSELNKCNYESHKKTKKLSFMSKMFGWTIWMTHYSLDIISNFLKKIGQNFDSNI